MCIGDNWNGKYCSLCGGDNGGWVMDPYSSIDQTTTEPIDDSACNDPCPEGYFKDATFDTMCIGDNWNGKYCSLCGGDNGGWVMDPCSSIDQTTTEPTDDSDSTP